MQQGPLGRSPGEWGRGITTTLVKRRRNGGKLRASLGPNFQKTRAFKRQGWKCPLWERLRQHGVCSREAGILAAGGLQPASQSAGLGVNGLGSLRALQAALWPPVVPWPHRLRWWRQSGGALSKSLTDKMPFLWRDMNLNDEERTPDLEGKAGMQQRGVPMPGRTEVGGTSKAALQCGQRQAGSWKACRSTVLGVKE